MGYINIFVNSDAKINLKNNQLTLTSKNKSIDYPMEDINSVMVDILILLYLLPHFLNWQIMGY